jgi:hypothetical protein
MPRRGATRARPDLPDAETLATTARACDAPGCDAVGEHRAPRDRSRLRDYYWFCLQHVREYNAAWDYYRGMDAGEIERHLREDAGWQRPTWPLGRLGADTRFDPAMLRDPIGALRDTPLHAEAVRRRAEEAARRRAEPSQAPPELRAALDVLGLEWPVDPPSLRARYKELAKRYHPDVNGGDRTAEDRLKDVNRAYSLLRSRLGGGATPRPAGPGTASAPAAAEAAAHAG